MNNMSLHSYKLTFITLILSVLLFGAVSVAQADHESLCSVDGTFGDCHRAIAEHCNDDLDCVRPFTDHLASHGLPTGLEGTGANFSLNIQSPLAVNSFPALVLAILEALMIIAVPIIVLCIVYAGFLYVTAGGNADKTRTATQALTYAIIGAIMVIGALAITEIIQETVCEFRPDNAQGC